MLTIAWGLKIICDGVYDENHNSERMIIMSDVKNAFDQINEFMSSEAEKTLLLRGIADKEKNLYLLKSLNSLGKLKGLIYLIHTTEDGMENFFRTAELYKVKVPSKYGKGMKLSNLTILFLIPML